jgi:hypothetical protein
VAGRRPWRKEKAVTPCLVLAFLTSLPGPLPGTAPARLGPGRAFRAALPAAPDPAARPDGPEKPPGAPPDPEREKRLAEWRKYVATLPKMEMRLTRLVVYRDGVVTYATYRNRTKTALRVSLVREPLLLLRGVPLKDSAGGVWQLPLLENHYEWVPDDTEFSARDVGTLTLLLPVAALLAVALARRVATSSRLHAVSPLLVLLGLWLLGPVAMLGSATASGGGFAQPGGCGAVALATATFPLTTPMLATYDGSLGGVALASLLLVLLFCSFARRREGPARS